MRDKDTYALREIFQYSSLAEKPLDQWEISFNNSKYFEDHEIHIITLSNVNQAYLNSYCRRIGNGIVVSLFTNSQ